MPKSLIKNARIELNTTEHVRTYLEQLVYTGMYGKSAGDAAALLVVRALNRLLRRGELTRLPPLHPIEPKEPSGDDGE